MPNNVKVTYQGASDLKPSMSVGPMGIQTWLLKAESRRTMVTGIHLEGAKRFEVSPGYDGFVICDRWEMEKHRTRLKFGSSLAGSGLGAKIADKFQHRYVVWLCTSPKDAPLGEVVRRFQGGLTCAQLARILSDHWDKTKSDGGWVDAALDVLGTAADIASSALT